MSGAQVRSSADGQQFRHRMAGSRVARDAGRQMNRPATDTADAPNSLSSMRRSGVLMNHRFVHPAGWSQARALRVRIVQHYFSGRSADRWSRPCRQIGNEFHLLMRCVWPGCQLDVCLCVQLVRTVTEMRRRRGSLAARQVLDALVYGDAASSAAAGAADGVAVTGAQERASRLRGDQLDITVIRRSAADWAFQALVTR